MIPTFALPGDRMPGQFGPISRTPSSRRRCVLTRSSSCAGMPSVIVMIVRMPASAASRIESAAKRAGTNTIAVLASVSATALRNVSNTGTPSTSWPDLPGVTPRHHVRAVALVVERVERALAAGDAGHAQARVLVDEDAHRAWRVGVAAASATTRSAASSIVAQTSRSGQLRLAQQAAPLLVVRAVEPDDERHLRLDLLERLDQALGHLVAARDPAEDVEQHRAHLLVGQDHLDRRDDRVGLRAAAGVEEVRRPAARLGDHVERATSPARRRCRGCRRRRRA